MGLEALQVRMQPRAAIFLLALAAVALLLASGCSRLSLLQSFAGSAIIDEAEFHLELDDAGAAQLARQVDEMLAWHSAEMLPRYAKFLTVQAELIEAEKMDRAAVGQSVAALRALLEELVQGTAPYVAAILVDHTDAEKRRYLEARMKERLDERRAELSEPADERLKERVERITKNFERVTGDLRDDQIAMIRRYAAATVGNNARWLYNRANRQRAFLEFLSRQPDESEISAFVVTILLRGHDVVEPDYKAISEARWAHFRELLVEIMASLSAGQRETASDTLREYAAEMIELSG